jgi:heme exporter protein C
LMIAAFYALFACCLLLNMRVELLRRESRTHWVGSLAKREFTDVL